MKVFISWSGVTSRAVAVALSEWFPKVLQGIKPFVSAIDIDKGANWTVVLTQELETSDFGVVCLTPDNLQSPWLHYEAGAISKSVSSRVCPVLFEVEVDDVQTPMRQLQITKLDPADMFQLMQSMNKVSPSPIPEANLQETVDMWWPALEKKLSKISVPSASDMEPAPEPPKPEVGTTELLEEVLQHVRSLDSRFLVFESVGSSSVFNSAGSASVFNRSPRVRRNEAQVDTTWRAKTESEVRDLFHMALSQLADIHGLNAVKGSINDDGIEITVTNPLTDSLPPGFSDAVIRIIGRQEVLVRFIGPDFSADFEKGVVTQGPPF